MLTPPRLLLDIGERLLPLAARVPVALQRLPLEPLLNQVFATPLSDGAFDMLYGRWLRLEIRDLDLNWYLTASPAGLRLAGEAPAAGAISGNWRDFLLLASRQEDPDTLFFRRRLTIEGDTELCLGIKNLIDSLDPEQMPRPLWMALQWLGKAAADRENAIQYAAQNGIV